MKVDNLYEHADGGFYCLLQDDAALKNTDEIGAWLDAVIYIGPDGKMRSTTRERWADRFLQVAEYTGDDEATMMMIRRANPGDPDLDFIRVFESWHESEVNLTGEMLSLAVAATLIKNYEAYAQKPMQSGELTIMTSDLQDVAANYKISKEPIVHGFIFKVEMISE